MNKKVVAVTCATCLLAVACALHGRGGGFRGGGGFHGGAVHGGAFHGGVGAWHRPIVGPRVFPGRWHYFGPWRPGLRWPFFGLWYESIPAYWDEFQYFSADRAPETNYWTFVNNTDVEVAIGSPDGSVRGKLAPGQAAIVPNTGGNQFVVGTQDGRYAAFQSNDTTVRINADMLNQMSQSMPKQVE